MCEMSRLASFPCSEESRDGKVPQLPLKWQPRVRRKPQTSLRRARIVEVMERKCHVSNAPTHHPLWSSDTNFVCSRKTRLRMSGEKLILRDLLLGRPEKYRCSCQNSFGLTRAGCACTQTYDDERMMCLPYFLFKIFFLVAFTYGFACWQ